MENSYFLADKSKLEVGDEVLYENERHTIIRIENGGAMHESIESETHFLSYAVLYTKDKNKYYED